MQPGIEVVLCTYNGAARLPQTLAALAAQDFAPDAWSVLVVDNASTDGTADLVRSIWARHDVALRIVTEMRPGQMYARQRALDETDRECVCFCDDDNWLDPDYLSLSYTLMTMQPRIGALGGRGVAVCDTPLPAWFELAAHGYAVGPQGSAEADVSRERCFVYGAGMVLRCAAWRQLAGSGFVSRLMGRELGRVNSGDDNEMCLGLALLGWRIVYSPRLVFRHSLAPRRLEDDYCRRLFRSFGEATVVLNAYRDFLLGHATPTTWRARALGRRAQGWLARLKQSMRPARPGPPTTVSLEREVAAGLTDSLRGNYAGDGLSRLYADIASWLATAQHTRP